MPCFKKRNTSSATHYSIYFQEALFISEKNMVRFLTLSHSKHEVMVQADGLDCNLGFHVILLGKKDLVNKT